jgi:hypothetical protein
MARRRTTARVQKIPKARRLPTGRYSYRGRALRFGDLPKREQRRLRQIAARKTASAKRRKVEARKKEAARFHSHWILRNGKRVGKRICLKVTETRGLRDVLFLLRWAVEEYDHRGVSYVATLIWPDALDKHGRPAVTHASTRFRADPEEGARDAREFFEDIEETPGILDQSRGRSGRPGRVQIVEICAWMLFTGKPRRPKGYKRKPR